MDFTHCPGCHISEGFEYFRKKKIRAYFRFSLLFNLNGIEMLYAILN